MEETDETVKFRSTRTMMRSIEEIVNQTRIKNRKEFVRTAIEGNIYSIQELLGGRKDIKDFAEALDSDISWVQIGTTSGSLPCKIDPDEPLEVNNKSEIDLDAYKVLKSCSRSSGYSKSALIRIAVIKQIYDMSEYLSDAREYKAHQRWSSLESHLKMETELLIDKIYYNVQKEILTQAGDSKLKKHKTMTDVSFIISHYETFKDTEGWEYLTDNYRGEKVIDQIETIKAEAEL